ncbi:MULTISPECIES: response regulator transcription factor [Flavobacterium]|mgnify:CR=1 FL=1|uniref:Response regulator transcription factor n=1 Tax=Flavobacterium sedimenticola TaxID=3043286 RepID=A0ABT6XLT0_9FLAO|nr:response regulator transcription factor [Flavobacterium sedimenticola]MDI9256044.1 response regulator transcription factor [Flavobacterium sedimenticola]
MKKILLVEDEAHVVSFIKKGLSEEGFEVSVAFDGKTGLQLALENTFDIIILDIMLPDVNGLDVCKAIRRENQEVPILFLTALGTSENIVLGLENGADDYLVKPFKFIELVARIKTLLRRSKGSSKESETAGREKYTFTFGDLVIDDYTKTVHRAGEEISLTSTEYKLLFFFMKNKNKVLSRQNILEAVWGVDYDLGTNVVDVYVNYLRKKIDGKSEGKIIQTVIGMGYVLRETEP